MQVNMKFSLQLTKPPSEVFEYLSDPDKMPEWQESMKKIKSKKNTDAKGKLKHGAKVNEHRSIFGEDFDSEWEVTEFDQDKTLRLRVTSGPLPWETVYRLEPSQGGTLLSAEGVGDVGNVQMPLAVVQKNAQNTFEKDLNRLKKNVEK
jgi:uncharacterized protein YndB with AHSA1/START domain